MWPEGYTTATLLRHSPRQKNCFSPLNDTRFFRQYAQLTSRRYFEPIARASMTFRFLDPPDTVRLSATVLPAVNFYHLPMGPMKDDISLMMNNVSRYPLPVLPSNPCVGFRLVLRIIIKVRLLYVQPPNVFCLESLWPV